MQHPDEGTIHAWLDGELSAGEVQALESHVAACPECSAKVAEARGLVAASSRIVSALDVIPGDVIPAATRTSRKRPWYSTAQFRAAAGILVVAGASLLLLNRGEEKAARSEAVTLSAKSPALASAPVDADAATETPKPVQEAARLPKVQEKKSASLRRTQSQTVAAPVETPQAALRAPEKMVDAAAGLSVVATGAVSHAPEKEVLDEVGRDLKLLSADTTQLAVRNVYEVRKGVEVTLVETTLPAQRFSAAAERQKAPTAQRVMAAAAPPPAANSAQPATNVITWVKGDKVFTLTGAMSRADLEALRLKLPEEKR